MHRNIITLLVILPVFGWTCATAQTPGSEIPITWTIHPGYSADPVTGVVRPCDPGSARCELSRVQADGFGRYTRDCRIRINRSSDAECFAGNGRYFLFDLTNPVARNQDPGLALPDWIDGTVRGTKMTIGNLLDASHHSWNDVKEYSFTTTWKGLAVRTSFGVTSVHYHLSMDDIDPSPNTPNDPYQTATIHVHHCPDTTTWAVPTAWCGTGQKETWWVYPASQTAGAASGSPGFLTSLVGPEAAHHVAGLTMRNTQTRGVTPIAQYSLPFLFSIRLRIQSTCAADAPMTDGSGSGGREERCDTDTNPGLYEFREP